MHTKRTAYGKIWVFALACFLVGSLLLIGTVILWKTVFESWVLPVERGLAGLAGLIITLLACATGGYLVRRFIYRVTFDGKSISITQCTGSWCIQLGDIVIVEETQSSQGNADGAAIVMIDRTRDRTKKFVLSYGAFEPCVSLLVRDLIAAKQRIVWSE